MTKYEAVVTKEEDIETAVSCPDQTPVAKKVEDVTHMEHHRRKRPFLKGVFVGVVGTLLVLKLHMVIRHCHRHNHPGRHHDVDHPPFPPPPAFEIESFDFPEDFPDDYMMKGEEIKWDEKEMPMWDHEDMMNKKEMWHEKKMHGKKMWHEKKMQHKKMWQKKKMQHKKKWDEKEMPMWDHEDMMNKKEMWHETKMHGKKMWHDKKMQHKKMWHEKKMQHKKMWNDKKMDNHPKDKVFDIMKEPVVEIPVEEKELKATKEGLPEPKVEINEAAEQVVRKEESP